MTPLSNMVKDSEKEGNLSLILATVWVIVENYAKYTKSPLILKQYAQTESQYLEHKDLIEGILTRTSKKVAKRFLLETDNAFDESYTYYDLIGEGDYFYRFPNKKDCAIWLLDSLDSFKRLEADLLNERERYQRDGFFCIIYTGRETNRFDIIKIIFRNLFSLYVTRVNLLMTHGKLVNAYTFFPFTPKRCHDVEPQFIGFFGPIKGYNFSSEVFFEKKIANLWHCPLKITTWTEPPFVSVNWEKDENSERILRLGGIEGMLVTVLSQIMNFSIRLVPPPVNDRGYYYPNGTATGATKMLIERETDIFFNCLKYDLMRATMSRPSYIYLNIPISLGIPKGRGMTPFERLIRPFKYIIWSCLTSTILVGIVFIFALKLLCKRRVQNFFFGYENRTPFTYFLSSLFGVAIHGNLPTRNFARYILLIWILYTFVMRTAYIGQLFIILQDSRARTTVQSLEEIIERNFTFFTFPTSTETLLASTTRPLDIQYVDSKENSLQKLFRRLSDENSKFVIALLGHKIRAYNQRPENREHQVQFLPKPLFISPITLYLQKHSFLGPEMDNLILRIMSVGLVQKFENINLHKVRTGEREEQEPTELSLFLLTGLFVTYFALLLFCGVVFLLERWSLSSPLTKRIIDFFNF